jgi:hypothetical protein
MPAKPVNQHDDAPPWWGRWSAQITGNQSCNWDVVEHLDGRITVSPSIKQEHCGFVWHGFLQDGNWVTCADTTVEEVPF